MAERRDWRAAGARARWQPYPRQPSRRPTGRSHRCRSWLTARFAAVRTPTPAEPRVSERSRPNFKQTMNRSTAQPQHSTIRSRSCSRHSPQPRNRTPPEQHDEQRRGRQERGLEGRPEHRQHQGPRTGAMTSPCRLDLACEPRLGRRRRPHARGCGARGAPPRLGGGPPPLGLPLEAGARWGYPQRSGARLNRIHGVRRMAPRSSSRSSASRR